MKTWNGTQVVLWSLLLAAAACAAGEQKPAEKQEQKGGRPEAAQKLFVEALQLENDIQAAREKKLGGEVERMTKLVVENYEKALKLCPGDGEICLSFGAHFFNAGQYEKALAQYDAAIEAFRKANEKGQLAQALYNKGSTLYTQEKFAAALKVLDEALALDPTLEEAQQVKKSCQENLKK